MDSLTAEIAELKRNVPTLKGKLSSERKVCCLSSIIIGLLSEFLS